MEFGSNLCSVWHHTRKFQGRYGFCTFCNCRIPEFLCSCVWTSATLCLKVGGKALCRGGFFVVRAFFIDCLMLLMLELIRFPWRFFTPLVDRWLKSCLYCFEGFQQFHCFEDSIDWHAVSSSMEFLGNFFYPYERAFLAWSQTDAHPTPMVFRLQNQYHLHLLFLLSFILFAVWPFCVTRLTIFNSWFHLLSPLFADSQWIGVSHIPISWRLQSIAASGRWKSGLKWMQTEASSGSFACFGGPSCKVQCAFVIRQQLFQRDQWSWSINF
jgi:hypothetical protein